jgi:hypothetical protein
MTDEQLAAYLGIPSDHPMKANVIKALSPAKRARGDFAGWSNPMTIMPDREWLELQQQRENERRASRSRFQRIRDWFFTPRGALVYFGIGYAVLGIWLLWR